MENSSDDNIIMKSQSFDTKVTESVSSSSNEEISLIPNPQSRAKNIIRLIKRWVKEQLLLVFTIVGVVLGLILGIILNSVGASSTTIKLIGFPGEILLRMLKMLVLPLITASIVVGVSSFSGRSDSNSASTGSEASKNAEKKLFTRILLYFALTTIFSVILGLVLVSIFQPGTNVDFHYTEEIENNTSITPPSPLDSILGVFRSMFPENLIKAAAELDILGIIVFAIVLGGVLVSMGDKGKPLLDVFESLNEAIMRIVMLVMYYAPIGIMSLIAARLGENEDFVSVLSKIGLFAATVITGLVIQCFIILPSIYFLFIRRNPFKFYLSLLQAIFTALGTDSSSATLPVSLKCVTEFGIDQKIAQIVLPLGATINMNGTALYEAIAAIFIAQLHGVHLSIGQMIIVALTATLAAVGAAGIPEAGLITMTMILSAVGLPLNDIGMLLTIDWFLDRMRTVVNVLSDCVGAAIVDKYYKLESTGTYEPLP